MSATAKSDARNPGRTSTPVEASRTPLAEPEIEPVRGPVPGGAGYSRTGRDLPDDAGPQSLAADHLHGRPTTTHDARERERQASFWDDTPDPAYDFFMTEDDDTYGTDDDYEDYAQTDGFLAQGVETVRRNPVGAGLILAGIALLAAPRLERETVRDHYRGARDNTRAHVDGHRRAAQARLRSLRDRVNEGTEGMSDEARKRVVAARTRAVEVKERASASMRSTASRADGTLRDNPLMTGAVAFGAGAALAAALPRTRIEDSRLGHLSDRLMDEARAIFEEERARLTAGATAAADETRDIAREAMQATRDSVPDGEEAVARSKDVLRESVGRVATAARDAADKGGS